MQDCLSCGLLQRSARLQCDVLGVGGSTLCAANSEENAEVIPVDVGLDEGLRPWQAVLVTSLWLRRWV